MVIDGNGTYSRPAPGAWSAGLPPRDDRSGDGSQLFDVEMQQVAGGDVLVVGIDGRGLQIANAVEFQPAQNPTYGNATQARGLRDAIARPALAAQRFDALDQDSGGGPMQPERA